MLTLQQTVALHGTVGHWVCLALTRFLTLQPSHPPEAKTELGPALLPGHFTLEHQYLQANRGPISAG